MSLRVRITDLAEPRYTPQEKFALAEAEAAPPTMTVSAVLQTAREITGLADFGPEDGFRDRLQLTLDEISEDPQSSAFGCQDWFDTMVDGAANRLRNQNLLTVHPQIADIEIRRPIIIGGLPRSGTTYLHNTIAADSRLRSVPLWESRQPVPDCPDAPLPPRDADPRLVRQFRRYAKAHNILPLRTLMHPVDPEHIEDDTSLYRPTFGGWGPEIDRRSPKWRAFYETDDQTPYYQYMRTVLKILQYYLPRERWVLKSPEHLEEIGPLMKLFPDATYVFTHRDPVAAVQSLSVMYAYRSRMMYTRTDPSYYIFYYTHMVRRFLQAYLRDRRLIPKGQLIEVLFNRFMADEEVTLEGVYSMAGLALTSEARDQLSSFREENKRGKGGSIAYDMSVDFGIDPADIRSQFDFYFEAIPVRNEIT